MTRAPLTPLLLSGLTLLLAARCGANPAAPADVQGIEWRLNSLQKAGEAAQDVPEPSRYNLRVDADGRLAARSGAQLCFADYTLSGSTFSVGDLQCTEGPTTPIGAAYQELLGAARSLTRRDATLTVSSPAGTLTFSR